MIKSDLGQVVIKGSQPVILSELSTLMYHMLQEEMIDVSDIKMAVALATLKEEELNISNDKLYEKCQKVLGEL